MKIEPTVVATPVSITLNADEAEILKFGLRAVMGFNKELSKVVPPEKVRELFMAIEVGLQKHGY